MRKYRAGKTTNKKTEDISTQNYNIDFFISKFQKLIEQGSLYVCTCCDELWYKHSVLDARKLRLSNPDIKKYLGDIKV